MFFELYEAKDPSCTKPPWFWMLVDGSPSKPGHALVAAPQRYDDEKAARGAIAAFRKKAGGIKFAKVVIA